MDFMIKAFRLERHRSKSRNNNHSSLSSGRRGTNYLIDKLKVSINTKRLKHKVIKPTTQSSIWKSSTQSSPNIPPPPHPQPTRFSAQRLSSATKMVHIFSTSLALLTMTRSHLPWLCWLDLSPTLCPFHPDNLDLGSLHVQNCQHNWRSSARPKRRCFL